MSTHVGNTTKAFGREYNVSVSNMGGDKLLQSQYLKENTLIIDSKINSRFEDVGSYSLFITDGDGKPVRLTYTIQPGNGLCVDTKDRDVIKMAIDNSSITAGNANELYVNKPNIIDNYTLTIDATDKSAKRGRIHVDTKRLDKATELKWGITKADEFTTYINSEMIGNEKVYNGIISVNTQNLETVDDATNRDGIVKHNSELSNSTIKADNGKLNVITENLEPASAKRFGISKGDEITINAINGVLAVDTQGLSHATDTNYGTVKVDNKTIKSIDGVINVNTYNLTLASKDNPGVIAYDDWSITLNPNDKRLEVKRYQEIESLLNNYDNDKENLQEQITKLDNRVTKLELISQEKIEFIVPVGKPTTILPEPDFDKKNWVIKSKYTDRKTIAFQIKSNCKFYVNVDYVKGTNDYGQVNLLSVQLANGDTISAESLSNHIFTSDDSKVQTINFTFAVKNYDADNNDAFCNTHVIINAASINNSAACQSSFHIFKCWNNEAFVLDEPNYEKPNIISVDSDKGWIIKKGTEYLQVGKNDDNSNTNTKIINNLTYESIGSKNFYFNTLVCASFYDNSSINNPYDNILINQSSTLNSDDDYKITVSGPDWLDCSINATYSSTNKWNVLTVKSKTPLTDIERTAYIEVKLANNNTISPASQINLEDVENLTGITSADTVAATYDASCTFISQYYTYVDPLLQGNELYKAKNYFVKSDKSILPVIYQGDIESKSFKDIIDNDINEFNNIKDILEKGIIDDYDNDRGAHADKEIFDKYETAKQKIHLYAAKIKSELTAFITSINNTISYEENNSELSHLTNENNRTLIFKYTEQLKQVIPVVNVSTTIGVNSPGIEINISRNKNSFLTDKNWGVGIKYNFVNTTGDLVDANGKVLEDDTSYYNIPMLYPGNSLSYTYNYSHEDISTAASGYRTETNTNTTYYNIFGISAVIQHHHWFDDYSPIAGVYFSGYDPATGNTFQTITDDVYAVFKVKRKSEYWYDYDRYFSIPLKDCTAYVEQQLNMFGHDDYFKYVENNSLEFCGISSGNNGWGSFYTSSYSEVKIGNNLYITKQGLGGNNNLFNNGDDLDSLIRTYYNNNSSILVYKSETYPVEVANNIMGIKIKSVDITSNAFAINDTYIIKVWEEIGSWKEGINDNSNNNYMFGNAKIANIIIDSWDDVNLTITFNITPGSETNIPNGTEITEYKTSNDGYTNFIFIRNNKSYLYTDAYTNYEFSSTTWNNGCTVTYRLYNEYSLNKTGVFDTKSIAYINGTSQAVYCNSDILNNNKIVSRTNVQKVYKPLLPSFTAMKFWIGLNTTGIAVQDKFESSTSSIGDQINVSAGWDIGGAKNLNLVNAAYGSSTETSNLPEFLDSNEMYCEKCGEKILKTDLFCPKCGAPNSYASGQILTSTLSAVASDIANKIKNTTQNIKDALKNAIR